MSAMPLPPFVTDLKVLTCDQNRTGSLPNDEMRMIASTPPGPSLAITVC